MSDVQRSLTIMVYGESKVGKSTFAVTAPYPRLMLDVEGGHRFLPITVKYWDPIREEPPVADGTWDTVVVNVRDYDVVLKTFQWLQTGKHQFKSLIIDSISELQVKCMDSIAGTEQMKMQQWGELLRHMGALLRDLRDLTMHPTQPLEAVVLTAMARPSADGRMRPYLQGQLAIQAPYFYDILGAINVETMPNPDPLQAPFKVRRMYVERTDEYEAGERVQGRLGKIVEQQDLGIERMLDMIFGPKAVPATQTTTKSGDKQKMSTLNWGDLVKEAGEVSAGYDALPDGDYDLVITEATAKVSQSGKTMFAVKAQVQHGAHAKRLIWDNLVITPDNAAALGMFFRKMSAIGLGREFFATNPSNAQIESAMQGRAFRAQVGSRTWQGQKKNEIKMYYPAAGGPVPGAAPVAAAAPAPAPAAAPAPAPAPAPVAAAAPAPETVAAPPAAPF